jgi:hypothetical protein
MSRIVWLSDGDPSRPSCPRGPAKAAPAEAHEAGEVRSFARFGDARLTIGSLSKRLNVRRMPTLRNPRHERFAQALAEGKSQQKAYVAAGYSATSARANASTLLKRNASISKRVQELLEARRAIEEQALAATVAETKADRLWVERQLLAVVERSMQATPVLDRSGAHAYVQTPEGRLAAAFTFDASAAVRALHLLGLEHGMFRHRVDHSANPFDILSVPDLVAFRDALLALKRERETPTPLLVDDKVSHDDDSGPHTR